MTINLDKWYEKASGEQIKERPDECL